MSERMRDIHSAVEPDSVSATIARTSRWFAVYITAAAMASSVRRNSPSVRRSGRFDCCHFSAPSITCAIARTTRPGWRPTAVSAESITASVSSITALATSETSARVGTGAWIMDSIICVAVITSRLFARARAMMCFCSPVSSA